VKELKGFRRISLDPGGARRVRFTLIADALAFHTVGGRRVIEPGAFKVWIGPSSQDGLEAEFELKTPASRRSPGRQEPPMAPGGTPASPLGGLLDH
jgi:hypothetical protein